MGMPKGLIKCNAIANKYYGDKFTLEVGINDKTHYVKLSDSKDCLPCEITSYRQAEFANRQDLINKVQSMEKLGYSVCIDTSFMFYETER